MPGYRAAMSEVMPEPLPTHHAVFVIVAAVVTGPLVGSLLAGQLLNGGVFGEAVGFFALPLVLGFGYKIWVARIASIAMRGFGWAFLLGIVKLLLFRKRPDPRKVLPDPQRVADMVRQALDAGSAFRSVGWMLGVPSGAAAALVAAEGMTTAAFGCFFLASGLYGTVLSRLARRGRLPMPEDF